MMRRKMKMDFSMSHTAVRTHSVEVHKTEFSNLTLSPSTFQPIKFLCISYRHLSSIYFTLFTFYFQSVLRGKTKSLAINCIVWVLYSSWHWSFMLNNNYHALYICLLMLCLKINCLLMLCFILMRFITFSVILLCMCFFQCVFK